MAKKKALGKGLSALLQESHNAYLNNFLGEHQLVEEIPISKIVPNPFQPRREFDQKALDELSKSIQANGLIQPIIVNKLDNDCYTLVAGERRLRASKLAKYLNINAIVGNISQEQLRKIALIENIQREDLNPIELSYAFNDLIQENGFTQEQLAKNIGKSRPFVANILRLLKLDKKLQDALMNHKISYGHAKVLVNLCNNDQKMILAKIIKNQLSVRATETLCNEFKDTKNHNIQAVHIRNDATLDLKALTLCFKNYGLTVRTKNNKIILSFENQEQIETIVNDLL